MQRAECVTAGGFPGVIARNEVTKQSRAPRDRRFRLFVFFLLYCLAVALASTSAFAMKAPLRKAAPASDEAAAGPSPTAEDAAPAPAETDSAPTAECVTLSDALLERSQRFSKNWVHEVGVFGGDYLGDEWLNTWDAGARYYLHINRTFAVGASYAYSRIRAGNESSFGRSLTTKDQHIADAELLISNDCALRAGKTIIDCDLFMTIGFGATQINDQWKWLALIGGGIRIYFPPPWIAIRFDVNSPIHPTPKPGGDSINADVMFNLGVSFFFPTRRIEPPEPGSQ